MPIGEFLYVKWRIKETGEVMEDRVDLRNKLARNMFEHGLTFVRWQAAYVYLRTPTPRNPSVPSGLKTYLADTRVTYEIYPHNTYNRNDGSGETLAGDFMQHAMHAIAPAWAVQTTLAHWQASAANDTNFIKVA